MISVTTKESTEEVKSITTEKTKDIKIAFEFASLEISRPWLDEEVLKLEGLHLRGLHIGGWSTGELSTDNDGVMPLVTDTIILARNIEISSTKFSKEVTDFMKETDWSKHCGVLVSIIFESLNIMLLMNSTVWALFCRKQPF